MVKATCCSRISNVKGAVERLPDRSLGKFLAMIVSIREQSRIKAAPPFTNFPVAAQRETSSIAPSSLTES